MIDGSPGQSAAIPPALVMRDSIRTIKESD
jgi:hypothetical protein